jgi:hypothetical protein
MTFFYYVVEIKLNYEKITSKEKLKAVQREPWEPGSTGLNSSDLGVFMIFLNSRRRHFARCSSLCCAIHSREQSDL